MSVNITALGLAGVAAYKDLIERAGLLDRARNEASTLFDAVVSDENIRDGELMLNIPLQESSLYDQIKGRPVKEIFNIIPKEAAFEYAIMLAKDMTKDIYPNKSTKELYSLIEAETGIHTTVPTLSEFYKEINVANFIYKTATGELPNKEVIQGSAIIFGIFDDSQYSDFIRSDNIDRIFEMINSTSERGGSESTNTTPLPELPTQEFTPLDQTDVSKLYVGIFGRASEGSGSKGWITFSSVNKADMAKVADTMLDTDAARAYFGNTLDNNFEMIKFFYENVFNKTYSDISKGMELDKEGIDAWVNELNNGKSKGKVITEILKTASLPALSHLDAAKLFNNKVVLSNKIANNIENADVNDLTQFINILKNVQPDTSESDINKLISNMGLTNENIDNTSSSTSGNGYTIDSDGIMVIDKNTTGIIDIDFIPKGIRIEDFQLDEFGHSYGTATVPPFLSKYAEKLPDGSSYKEAENMLIDIIKPKKYGTSFNADEYELKSELHFDDSKIGKYWLLGNIPYTPANQFRKLLQEVIVENKTVPFPAIVAAGVIYIEKDGLVDHRGVGFTDSDIVIKLGHGIVLNPNTAGVLIDEFNINDYMSNNDDFISNQKYFETNVKYNTIQLDNLKYLDELNPIHP